MCILVEEESMDLEPSPMEDDEIECSPVAPSTPTQDMVEYDKSKYTRTILQLIEGRKEDMGFYVAGNWEEIPFFSQIVPWGLSVAEGQ